MILKKRNQTVDMNALMVMLGDSSITDGITGTAFTMAGTPTTATLLGATAPTIAAGAYTSCKIATPLIAGQALSILCVVSTAWAGNDGVTHYLFDANDTASHRLRIFKFSGNNLFFNVGAGGATSAALDGTNWAAGTHIIIGTVTAGSATVNLYLDGVPATPATGVTREGSLNANAFIGTSTAGANPLTGSILCAIWPYVLDTASIARLSSLSSWGSLTNISVSNLPYMTAARLYDTSNNAIGSAVESGGTATITPTDGLFGWLGIYQDDSYTVLLDRYPEGGNGAGSYAIYGGDEYYYEPRKVTYVKFME